MITFDSLWEADNKNYSVTYPIEELLRRAKLKVTIWDRDFPIVVTGKGLFQSMVKKLIKFKQWKRQGVKTVVVYYQPHYFLRNSKTVRLMDPLHSNNIITYEASKA
jgi:hypothetical protein